MVGTDDRVGVVKSNLADVRNSLDLGSALLVLRVGHLQAKLLSTALDRVPSSKPAGKVYVSGHAEILRVDNLVCRRVVENGLSVDTSLVGESTESGDVVLLKLVHDLPSLDCCTVVELALTLKGMLTSTRSATRSSTSLRALMLYLLVTYSRSATIMRAMRPPRGVIPLRSPIPSTEVSM